MFKKLFVLIHLLVILSLFLAACGQPTPPLVTITPEPTVPPTQAPTVTSTKLPEPVQPSATPTEAVPAYQNAQLPVEQRVEDLLSRMSLAEKIGQMTQVEKGSIKPEGVRDFFIGSILSGGGGYPNPNTPDAWAEMVDGFQEYALQTPLAIPMIYGVDAVHGHGNLMGATIFPHNIGLGATHDADLVERIGRSTAEEMVATGIRWDFSPVIAVTQDIRWGRTYESFSENTELVTELGTAYVTGLQNGLGVESLADPTSVLATPKHFIGDGATAWGSSTVYKIDQGDMLVDEATLRTLLLPPYQAAIEAGAQSIMVSFSSWKGTKMHAEKYLLTDVLKDELGFTGFLISDWQAVDQISEDYYEAVVTSINAGLDMVMVPSEYEVFIKTLTSAVEKGDVSAERIDDAVRRILRVKFEMGLFEQPYADPANLALVGTDEHHALAREAVAKSAVLLKNDNAALPVAKDTPVIFVAGEMADNVGDQAGGWTIEWQGKSGNTIEGTSILEAITEAAADPEAVYFNKFGKFDTVLDADGKALVADVAFVVVGEKPYTEGVGDKDNLTLTKSQNDMLARVRAQSQKVVVIIISGRPLVITDQLAQADAWVAAWLPGTEAGGLADVLFGDLPFTGKLPFSWPRAMDQIPFDFANLPTEGCDAPLFPFGYGLDADSAPVEIPVCGEPAASEPTDAPSSLNGPSSDRVLVIDDFENGQLPNATVGYETLGFLTWSDGSPVSIETVSAPAGSDLALPDQAGDNTLLKLNTAIDSGGWAGFTHAFTNESLDAWTTQDWSSYMGLGLWIYGNGTGGNLYVEILDNRAPDSIADDAERWNYTIIDDFEGWQYLEIPFDTFSRKDIGNGAPNDGLNLTEVHGYAVGGYGSAPMGELSNYVDSVVLYGQAPVKPLEVAFASAEFATRESGRGKIKLELSKGSDVAVTVKVFVAESVALAGQDFTIASETATFEPGQTQASIDLTAIDDNLAEPVERVVLILAEPTVAQLGFIRRAVLSIRDNDTADPNSLFGFEQVPPFFTTEGVEMNVETVSADSDLALPEQTGSETVLAVDVSSQVSEGMVGQDFAQSRDWSEQKGLSFWYYGTGSGQQIKLEVLDNAAPPTAFGDASEWDLLWQDEFNGPAGTPPNPAVWTPELGDGLLNGIPGWGNNELEYYTKDPRNVSADGQGNLAITARQVDGEAAGLICSYGPCKYTSARLITLGKAEFAYGRVEARLKLPEGQGIWPAFWMLGTNLSEAGWPGGGEIDIMENIGRETDIVHGTAHGPGYSGGSGLGAPYTFSGAAPSDDFHVYAIEWTSDEIRWFVDDNNYFTLTPADLPAGAEWVYDHPFFIILNLAVGGSWPGNPSEATTFPQTLLVDYVRVYSPASTAERYEVTFTDDFKGWKQMVFPFADFKRSSSQPDGAPDDDLNLNEVWGWRLWIVNGGPYKFYMDQMMFAQ